MKPTSFTVKGDTTHFHYKMRELRTFIRMGKKDGNNGFILVRRKDNLFTYKGFGSFEGPRKYIHTITIAHNPFFDGRMPTDEEIISPGKPSFNL